MLKFTTSFCICLFLSGCSLSQVLVDEDSDGILNHKDICKQTPLGAQVDRYGCAIDSDKDGVIDLFDICPHTPLTDVVNAQGCTLR